MRESCQCGGFIATFSHKRVKEWRATHVHEGRPEPEPDKQGAESRVEHAGARLWEVGDRNHEAGQNVPIVNAKAGFRAKR